MAVKSRFGTSKSSFDAKRVINGSYGEVWIDGIEATEVTALEAKIALTKQDIDQCRVFLTGSKIVGGKGTGTLKGLKVTSYFSLLVTDAIKKGRFPGITIISNLEDPDAYGAERVKFTGVTFDEVTLANWEVKKTGEQSVPFTFTDFDFIDKIDISKLNRR